MSEATIPGPVRWRLNERWRRWRAGLFGSPLNAIVSLVTIAILAWALQGLARWAVVNATWSGTPEDCARNSGACWAFVRANIKLMFFGTYPSDYLWRPILSLILMFGLMVASMSPRLWSRALILGWIGVPVAVVLLLGGTFSNHPVSTNDWSGLPLTLLIWTIGYAAAFVIAIPLALARRSGMGGLRLVSTAFIEVVRGLPMVVILLVSSQIVPMMLPAFDVNLFFSVTFAVTIFIACYLAEVIRAGIQSLPAGQGEAARALGLSYWHTTGLVILPQALRAIIPPLVNLGIGVFLSTPLIAFIGMIDFIGAVKAAASREDIWPGRYTEAYVFAAIVYFAICFTASRYSLWLERRLKDGQAGLREKNRN